MKLVLPEKLEAGRVDRGRLASSRAYGGNGLFIVQGPCGARLTIMASDGQDPDAQGWEHVSVSTDRRCPNWIEMCFVKDLFWSAEACVVQFHPRASQYIDCHPYCLHLWRHPGGFPEPPPHLVGIKLSCKGR
jgi:hypothetical protein